MSDMLERSKIFNKRIRAIELAASLAAGFEVAETEEEKAEILGSLPNVKEIAAGAEWRVGVKLLEDTEITYNGKTYIVIKGKTHISQAGREPDKLLHNLFEEIKPDFSEWEQPQAHNPYMIGDKVTYQGEKYESTIDNNVHAPGVVPGAWKQL